MEERKRRYAGTYKSEHVFVPGELVVIDTLPRSKIAVYSDALMTTRAGDFSPHEFAIVVTQSATELAKTTLIIAPRCVGWVWSACLMSA